MHLYNTQMHVRTNLVHTKNRTYRYTQIVQSYRNDEGNPVHKVLASFKDLSEVAASNLRLAIAAARESKSVVLADNLAHELGVPKCSHNLEYLGLAVLHRLWQRLKLDKLVDALLPQGASPVHMVDVIEALALQRCVAPGSKLSAERWYPSTALPELQGIAPAQFNNTRIHRVLDTLESIEGALQDKLPAHLESQHGHFVWIALDITNTWFEGQGPPMARRAKTKEGLLRQRIGVALMCDYRGLPLRWKTLQGNYYEGTELTAMLEAVRGSAWVGQRPVIVDRALGRSKTVEWMHDSGIRFLTAVPVNEFGSYTDHIPWSPFDLLCVAGTDAAEKKDLERICRTACSAGLQRIADDCYLLDLGNLIKHAPERGDAPRPLGTSRVAQALKKALELQAEHKQGQSVAALSKAHDVSRPTVSSLLRLAMLNVELQRRVLDGEVDGATIGALMNVAQQPVEQQPMAFEGMVANMEATHLNAHRSSDVEQTPGRTIRAVVVFNPLRFLDQRKNEIDKLRELEAFVADLNTRLSVPRARRGEQSIRHEVDRQLRVLKLHACFEIVIEPIELEGTGHYRIALVRKDKEWQTQRRYDGFHLFVAHPDLTQSAAELVQLYYAKNAVERDFQTIKGVIELRPVRHRLDPKVRAHVTLCMLSLLLERTLELELKGAGINTSTPMALDQLRCCHLNRFALETGPVYSVTEPDAVAKEILSAIRLQDLVHDVTVAEAITPR